MAEKGSEYPVQEEIDAFMNLHGIETEEELLKIPTEELSKMEGCTVHMLLEVYRRQNEK
jgi:hypothetical protein